MAKRGWGKFVVGAGIGAGLGLLFAPKAGKETRKELKVKIDDLVAKAKDLDKEKVLKLAKEKSEVLKGKANELVELAKEKGTPVLKDAADEVKEKALKVAKEVVAKLEKEGK